MHKVTVAWGDGSTCVFVRISYVPKASKVKSGYCNHLAKKICGRAGSDDYQELHLDTCWDMNWQWLQVRFVFGSFSFW